MKKYEVHYDVVKAVDFNGERKVIDVASKKTKLTGEEGLDVQQAIAALEDKPKDAIVITAVSSKDESIQ